MIEGLLRDKQYFFPGVINNTLVLAAERQAEIELVHTSSINNLKSV